MSAVLLGLTRIGDRTWEWRKSVFEKGIQNGFIETKPLSRCTEDHYQIKSSLEDVPS
jgi:hypothetical protein